MKTNNTAFKKWLFVTCFFAATSMLLPCAVFSATVNVNWCGNYRAQFTDSGGIGREDYLNTNSVVDISAQYMEAAVFHDTGSGWAETARGYMTRNIDGRYCFQSVLPMVKGDNYRLRLYTKLMRGNRMVMIMSDASTWDAPNRFSVDYDFTVPTSWQTGATYTFHSWPTVQNKNLSAVAVVQRLLASATTLGYPETTDETPSRSIELYLNQEWSPQGVGDGCWTQFYAGTSMSDANVLRVALCVPPTTGGNGAVAVQKFQIGHEIGHGLSAIISGPINSYGNADSSGIFSSPFGSNMSMYCQCPYAAAHCVQSREYIGTASGESFATFVSSTLFNNRDPVGHFTYYKAIYYNPEGSDPLAVYPPPNLLDWSEQTQWMRNNCRPADNHVGGLGAEWDWIEFFWQIWGVSDTGRFDMSNISTVWKNTGFTYLCCSSASSCINGSSNGICPSGTEWHPFGQMWGYRNTHPGGLSYLVDTADLLLNNDKYQRFLDLGSTLGVNGEP